MFFCSTFDDQYRLLIDMLKAQLYQRYRDTLRTTLEISWDDNQLTDMLNQVLDQSSFNGCLMNIIQLLKNMNYTDVEIEKRINKISESETDHLAKIPGLHDVVQSYCWSLQCNEIISHPPAYVFEEDDQESLTMLLLEKLGSQSSCPLRSNPY